MEKPIWRSSPDITHGTGGVFVLADGESDQALITGPNCPELARLLVDALNSNYDQIRQTVSDLQLESCKAYLHYHRGAN